MSRPLPLRSAATALVGPTIWAGHFLTVYASESLLCVMGTPALHDSLTAVATLAAVLILAWHGAIVSQRRKKVRGRRDLTRIAIDLDMLSILAVCFTAGAAVALRACAA
jgi:hypothetical protein